jgi:hypothetical protein
MACRLLVLVAVTNDAEENVVVVYHRVLAAR